MSQYVITANDLRDGLVVYLDSEGDWCSSLEDGCLVGDVDLQAALAEGKRAEDDQRVVGVYEVSLALQDGRLMPERLRERIRAFGPSTHVDFARADMPEHLTHPDGVEAVRFGAA